MRSTIALSLVLIVLLVPQARGQAGDPPAVAPNKTNVARLRWLRYNLVAGRIVASGNSMTFGPANFSGRQRERLEIRVKPGSVDLRYELSSPVDQLAIQVGEEGELSIEREHADPAYALRFEQLSAGPLKLSIERPEGKRAIEGASFWHLYLAEPELVRRHLVPLVELLHASWQLGSLGTAIENVLVERAPILRAADTQRWTEWIAELGSPTFSRRENAQRELYKAGQAVLPFLEQFDRDKLDAEQLARVRSLVDALSVGYEDTPDRVATWLANDPQIWLLLAARDEPATRQVAHKQLVQLLGTPLDFDPLADAHERGQQLDRLRARLQKPRTESATESDAE